MIQLHENLEVINNSINMDNDDDLYNDLPEETTSDYIAKIENKLECVQRQYDDSQKLIKDLNAEKHRQQKCIQELEKKIEGLERNISSLYRTAVSEIKRKDNMLNELRAENDNLAFRRRENCRNRSTYWNTEKSRDCRDTRRRYYENASPTEEKYKNKSRIAAENAFHSREMIDRKSRYDERQRINIKLEKTSSSEKNEHRSNEFNDQEKHHRSRTKLTDIKEKHSINSYDRVENPSARSNPRVNEHRDAQVKREPLSEELNISRNDHRKVRENQQLLLEKRNCELNDHRSIREKQQSLPEEPNRVLNDYRSIQEKQQPVLEKPCRELNDHRSIREKQQSLPEEPNRGLNNHRCVREKQQPISEKSNCELNDHRSAREKQQSHPEELNLVRNNRHNVLDKEQPNLEKVNPLLKDHCNVREKQQPLPEIPSLTRNDYPSVRDKQPSLPGKLTIMKNDHHVITEKQQLLREKPNLVPNYHRGTLEKEQPFLEKNSLVRNDQRGVCDKQQLLSKKSNFEKNILCNNQPQTKLYENNYCHVGSETETETTSSTTNGLHPENILGNSADNGSNKALHKTPAKNIIEEILSQRSIAALFSMKKQPGKLLTPLKDTPDYLKEKFSQIENNKINAKIPMINEQRMLSPFKNVGIVEIVSRHADEEKPSETTEKGTIIACSVTVSEDVEHGVFSRKSRKRPRIQKIVTDVKKISTS